MSKTSVEHQEVDCDHIMVVTKTVYTKAEFLMVYGHVLQSVQQHAHSTKTIPQETLAIGDQKS